MSDYLRGQGTIWSEQTCIERLITIFFYLVVIGVCLSCLLSFIFQIVV